MQFLASKIASQILMHLMEHLPGQDELNPDTRCRNLPNLLSRCTCGSDMPTVFPISHVFAIISNHFPNICIASLSHKLASYPAYYKDSVPVRNYLPIGTVSKGTNISQFRKSALRNDRVLSNFFFK